MKSRILLASALLLAGCQSTQQVNAPSTTTKKTIIIEKPVTTVPTSPSSVLETQPHQVPKKNHTSAVTTTTARFVGSHRNANRHSYPRE